MDKEADFSSKQYESWRNSNLLLRCGKTSLALFPQTLDEILQQSSPHFENAGRVTSRGEFWTRNILEWRKGAAVSSLSRILQESVPLKYFLSARACAGILRRAAKRGKQLPPRLEEALQAVAHTESKAEPKP